VTATNSHGSASATSNQTAVVTGLVPVNTVAPVISGTTMEGQTLHTSNGFWTNSPTSYAYQWRRCDSSGGSCTNIAAAYSNSYPVTVTDIGRTLRVAVTASNAYGSSSEVVFRRLNGRRGGRSGSQRWRRLHLRSGSDHKIKCLGLNSDGQLGNGGTTNKSYPVSVSGISSAVQISAGAHHSCALLSDHTIKCWAITMTGSSATASPITAARMAMTRT